MSPRGRPPRSASTSSPSKRQMAETTQKSHHRRGGGCGVGGGTKNNNTKTITTTTTMPSSDGRTWIYFTGGSTTTTTTHNDTLTVNSSTMTMATTSDTGHYDEYDDSEELARQYLGKRIIRPIVRSLHGGYSYFKNSNHTNNERMMMEEEDTEKDDERNRAIATWIASGLGGDGTTTTTTITTTTTTTTVADSSLAAITTAATTAVGEVSTDDAVEVLEEGAKREQANNNNNNNSSFANELSVVYVTLPPPLEQSKTTTITTTTTNTFTDANIMAMISYSDFFIPSSSLTSSSTNFKYGMNYNTHLPGRNVIVRSGGGGPSMDGSSGSLVVGSVSGGDGGGYILRLPMTGGTIIGYSPPPEAENDDDYDDYCNENNEEEIIVVRNNSRLHHQLLLPGGGGSMEFPIERQKEDGALFRILWDGHTTNSGYVEDLTLLELQSCLALTTTSSSSSSPSSPTTSFPSPPLKRGQLQKIQQQQQRRKQEQEKQQMDASYAVARHLHATSTRHTLAFEWKIECEILPHLVLVAALELRKEIALKIRWRLLVERRNKKLMEKGLEGGGGIGTTALGVSNGGKRVGGGDDEEIINQNGDAFGYYAKHPNQYMPSFVPPPIEENNDGDDDDDDNDNDEEFDGKKKKMKKSITKLTETEMSLYHSRLEAECNIQPSKIAERVRQACSMAYDCMISRGHMDMYYFECERREECERLEREKMMGDVGRVSVGSRGSSGMMSDILPGEVRRSSRPRAVVNYAEDGATALTTGHEYLNVSGRRRGGGQGGIHGGGTLASAFLDEKSLLPRESSPGGPTALYLLDLLKMLPTEEGEESDKDDTVTKEEGNGDDFHDEKAELGDNDSDPFFEPSACLIIDQLGRKQRYLSPASIQAAIVRGIEDQIDTPNSLLDEEELEEIANHYRLHKYVTDLVCTTGDKVEDLGQYEPASFARCRFAPHTFLAETGEEGDHDEEEEDMATLEEIEAKERRREERRNEKKAAIQKRNAEMERVYRAKKSFEVWRFRSIHGDGYTVFPLWRDTSRESIKKLCTSGESGMDGVGLEVDEVGAVKNGEGASENTVPITEALGVPSTSEVVPAESVSGPPVQFPPAATNTQNDEELARALAAEADSDIADGEAPLAKRRRITRLARSSTAATGGIDQVFYGGSMSMSRDQLLDSILRLLQQASGSQGGVSGGSSSLMNLKRIIFPESYESRGGLVEMRKLRAALGHLVYKMGTVRRLFVTIEESDGYFWDLLRNSGPLIKFMGDDDDGVVADSTLKIEEVPYSENGESYTSAAHSSCNLTNGDFGDPTTSATNTLALAILPPPSTDAPAIDHHLMSQLQSLENYISSLHHTELTLRNSLMKAIDHNSDSSNGPGSLLQMSTLAIATASDEIDGSTEAEDWKYFLKQKDETAFDISEDEKIVWNSDVNSHGLLGQVIYRPRCSSLRPSRYDDLPDNDAQFLNDKCYWYKVVSYTPSIRVADEIGGSEGGNSNPLETPGMGSSKDSRPRDSAIVERRMRFRAIPVAEADVLGINDEGAKLSTDISIDNKDSEQMILTQGQVYAGLEAATLWWSMRKKQTKPHNQVDYAAASPPHPYRNRYGSRVMLTPHPKFGGDEGEDGKKFEVLFGIIAGYDILHGQSAVANKLLVLLDDDERNDAKEEQSSCGVSTKPSGSTFWSTIVDDSNGTTLLTDIHISAPSNSADNNTIPSSFFCPTYTIALHEFHQGSEAYNVCSSIVSYLKSHSRIGPFLNPVDTVALQLHDYFTVVTHPMDVSTLEKNLMDGKYSRVSPSGKLDKGKTDSGVQNDEAADSPVYRMVYNGGFYDDIMLIFDNCVKYNGEQSWIGNEATKLKKNTIKKVEMIVSKAVWQGQGQGMSRGYAAGNGKQLTYDGADSDEDMYEYESDEDDYHGGGGNRRSKKGRVTDISVKIKDVSSKKKLGGKEDIASKAIEQQFIVPEHSSKFGTADAFPHIKIQTNVGKFTWSQNLWSCRYRCDAGPGEKSSDGNGNAQSIKQTNNEAENEELRLLLQLQEQEDSGLVRRSTRERHAPQNYAEEDASSSFPSLTMRSSSTIPQSPVSIPGVEYYLVHGEMYQPKRAKSKEEGGHNDNSNQSSTIPTVCRSRLGAEGIQELIHECFYAKLYRDHSPNALILESGLGTYAGGSFPPYLGRVIPSSIQFSNAESVVGGSTTTSSNSSSSIIWEIREQYLVPALRWIMRGLVRSGHLDEVDGSLSEGVLEDAASRSSFGSGIVVPNHEYFYNSNTNVRPFFDVLDEKEILRTRRQNASVAGGDGNGGGGLEEKVELSEYELMRAARVARNADRLKALGLA